MAQNRKVEMTVQISGTRDGQSWPAPGETISVPDAEARVLIDIGVAKTPEKAAARDVETTSVAAPETAGTRSDAETTSVAAPETAAERTEAPKPKKPSKRSDAEPSA